MDKELGYKILEKITQVTVDIAEIKRDIAHHIERTDLNEERIRLLENVHVDCPAREALKAKKTLIGNVKDWAAVIGLVVVILKLFNIIPFSF